MDLAGAFYRRVLKISLLVPVCFIFDHLIESSKVQQIQKKATTKKKASMLKEEAAFFFVLLPF